MSDNDDLLNSDKKERVFPDGAYFINSILCKKRMFCIKDQIRDDGANLLNGKPSINAHQCFIFKYKEDTGYYTIMALHSHKFLGVSMSVSDFTFSLISQYSYSKDYLLLWDINLITESCYTLELVGTDLFLELDIKTNKLQLNQRNLNENALFIIKPIQILENNIYIISGKYNSNCLSFPTNSIDTIATLAHLLNDKHYLFYIHFDEHDGCYSITNPYTLHCLSTINNSTKNCYFYQNLFDNLDHQKFIISSFDTSKGDFFIELKSNLLRLEIANYSIDNEFPIILGKYKPHFRDSKNQLFHFYNPKKRPEEQIYNRVSSLVTKTVGLTYTKGIEISEDVVEIESDRFINRYFMQSLTIPYSVKKIAKNALKNCRMINEIECDPKWLKLLPNPLKVEDIIVVEKVKEIKENDFKNFKNLLFLSLPSSLIKVAPNAFENIVGIQCFRGNLKFINLINTSSLRMVVILPFVKCIPKEAFAGCSYLKEVKFEGVSKLEVIESRAFANCCSLEAFSMPNSVKNISPDAFVGCRKDSIPKITQESQRLSMLDNLIIDSYVTTITKDYSSCFNVESLEIPMTVDDIEKDVFIRFKRLKYIKCDPKWLKCFPNSKIEMVFIPDGIEQICKKDFEKLTDLTFIEIPDTVDKIEENSFDSCDKLTSVKCGTKHLNFLDQKNIKTLILSNEVKSINQSIFKQLVNLESLVLPEKILIEDKETIFLSCKKLTKINNSYAETLINNKAFIEEGTTKIAKNEFEDWINLSLLSIPGSVIEIEPDSFENCANLRSLICDPKFFHLFANKCIKNVTIPDFVTEIKKSQFDNLPFITNLTLPENIKINDPTIFDSCINLININGNPHIFDSLSEITRKRFIKKVEKIEYVKPIFNYPPESIQFVHTSTENKQNIENQEEEQNESNKNNEKQLLDEPKRKENSNENKNDNNNNEKDDLIISENDNDDELPSKNQNKKEDKLSKNDDLIIFDESVEDYSSDSSEKEEEKLSETLSKSLKRPKETTVNDLVAFDSDNEKYARYIVEIQTNIIQNTIPKSYKPKNTSLPEISRVCSSICSEINRYFKTTPRPVQILVVLRLADNILNNNTSHGAIGEIKTGEGKSLVITILSIVLVRFNRKVDIVSSNLELVKRDQSEHEPYFRQFGIKTGVLFNKKSDYEFFGSMKEISLNYQKEQKQYSGFNISVLNYPVVYSTNHNYEHLYLHTLFNMNPRNREYDVVLVDEVDNMFIDDSKSSSRIAYGINYAYSNDILEIVFLLQSMDTNDIIKILEYYFPKIGIFEEESIEMLKDAAKRACELKKKVDYIIEDNEIVIIDSNTGFKKKKTRWSNYIHEMIEIKEGMKPKESQVETCCITQKGYFNLYKKVVGVTGTIGSPGDEHILKQGYDVDIFKVPRHFESQMKVFIKDRPSKMSQLYKNVSDEIIEERNKGRPVLVIWDSIFHADEFARLKPFLLAQKILGVKPELDRRSIKNAGKEETVTIATSAAGRGVDIKLSQKAIEAGGLHVIIPMNMPNQRSLEQAAGRAGRQGQPGSVTFYTSDEDRFIKQPEFKKGDENLMKLQLNFTNYLRKNFPWVLLAPRKIGFTNIVFPFNASPSDIINILVRYIAFITKKNPFEEGNERVQDLSLEIIELSWGVFFSGLLENVDECDDWNAINDIYEDFIRDLSIWFPPNKCTSADKAIWHIRKQLARELDWEFIIVSGIKIAAIGLCVVFPASAPSIIIGTGIVLSGGQEIYHQLQNGDKINWVQVLIRCGGSFVRNAIFLKFGINNKALNMILYFGENKLYTMAATENSEIDDDDFYGDDELDSELNNSIRLSKNINGTSQNTNKWLCRNIKHKSKQINLIKFKPKIYSAILNIDFIRMSMKLAQNSYTGKFRIGKTILSSEENDLFKPKFYCVEDSDNFYVITRGSDSLIDWKTDFKCLEIKQIINEKVIYFHMGFYYASNYILSKIRKLLNQTNKTIYFIGHSYGGAVSTVLTLLTKSDPELKEKKIYAIAFAPPPAISYCPPNISDCIFAFINRNDIVTSFSLFNLMNLAAKNHCATNIIVNRCLKVLKRFKMSWIKDLVYGVEENFEQITAEHKILNVRNVKGKIYRIGVGNKKRLSDYRIKESQLPKILVVELTSAVDHGMDEYVKSFKIVQF